MVRAYKMAMSKEDLIKHLEAICEMTRSELNSFREKVSTSGVDSKARSFLLRGMDERQKIINENSVDCGSLVESSEINTGEVE